MPRRYPWHAGKLRHQGSAGQRCSPSMAPDPGLQRLWFGLTAGTAVGLVYDNAAVAMACLKKLSIQVQPLHSPRSLGPLGLPKWLNAQGRARAACAW